MFERWSTLELWIAGSAFTLVLALWVMGLVAWQMHRSRVTGPLQRRLGTAPPEDGDRELRLWRDGQEAVMRVPGRPDRLTLRQRLDKLQNDAGLQMPADTLLLWMLGLAAGLGLLVLAMFQSVWAAVGTVLLVIVGSQAYLDFRIRRHTSRFEKQLISALDLAARSLRAGHPLLSSFRLIAEEVPAPVGTIFARVCQQQAMGMGLEQALRRVAEETGSDDLKVFATSVVIQKRSGANLADMMDRLTEVIRDRMRLSAHIRVITAQTRFSTRLLLAVPILLFIIVNWINPQYMQPLYSTDTGKMLLAVGAAGMVLGAYIMKRMARLRY
jgi:tight adherence protein B